MKKNNKLIIRIICILIVCIIITLIFLIQNINKTIKPEITEEIGREEQYQIISKPYMSKMEYLNIKNILAKYISEINQKNSRYYGWGENNNYTIIVEEKEINKNIYNILSEEYIKKNSINIDNVKEYVYKIEENCFYIPINIEKKYELNNIKSYGISGVIVNTDYKPVKESYIILNIDETNKTFSVEQINSKEELNNIDIEKVSSIENKGNNIYSTITGALDENIVKDYILTYKRLALSYPEIVYENFLDDEYKSKKFKSVEDYKKYITENKNHIIGINVEKYTVEEQEGYTQYIVIDKKDKYYIFNASSINNYKILLDNYTVNIPQFIKKYEASRNEIKIGYNIQKCIDAINNKDYKYVYDKLDNTFKNNNYNTEDKFANFIKNNFYERNKVIYNSVSNEAEIYIYNITIENSEKSEEKKNMVVIMALKDEMDFTMSFSIQ